MVHRFKGKEKNQTNLKDQDSSKKKKVKGEYKEKIFTVEYLRHMTISVGFILPGRVTPEVLFANIYNIVRMLSYNQSYSILLCGIRYKLKC